MSLVWSHCILDGEGSVIDAVNADEVHSTASIGKLFLLCEAGERIATGQLDPRQPLRRLSSQLVEDSGLWQHLSQEELALVDICQLIAAVSDNWATNTLLDVIGVPAVRARGRELGCERSGLHDRVRRERRPEDPPMLSSGTARELAEVAHRVHVAASGTCVAGISPEAAVLVERWLLAGVDLSMVAAPFHLDPLAHMDGPVWLWSKTGCDSTVRADVGAVWTERQSAAYAALASWEPGGALPVHPADLMADVGRTLAARMRPEGT